MLHSLFHSLKKILLVFLLAILTFNIALFYFLNWKIYFLALIIWNIVFIWISIPVLTWLAKTIFVDKWLEIAENLKENIENKTKENIIKTIKK